MPFTASVDTYLLFFFSALGVFNGLLLAVYFLFVARPWHISNGFMGALLLALCIRVGKSVFYYFNDDLSGIYIQIGITGCAFIGPFLYFYLHSLIYPDGKMNRRWIYHMLILLPVVLGMGIFYPYRAYYDMWQAWMMDGIYLEWLGYLIAGGVIVYPVLKKRFQAGEKLSPQEFWMGNVYIGTSLIWLAYTTSYITSYISGAITFSFLTYLLGVWYVFRRKKQSILFRQSEKAAPKKLDEARAAALLKRFHQLMEEEAPYQNPQLKSRDLAQSMDISVNELSMFLNGNLGKRFTDCINAYRVARARQLMASHPHYTLEAIGYEAGFHSKSTFYSAFKKVSGVTPARFRKQQASTA